jgi:predicted lipid-binding transport protein (Tim44 family)
MRQHRFRSTLVLSLLALPLAACQTDSGRGFASGAVGGAVVGAVVGGPVGAAVGGVAGAAVGGILTAEETIRVRTYVATQRSPSVQVAGPVAVGQPAPRRARLSPLPASVGLRNPYHYTVVNDRTVLVNPRTREIVEIIE